MTLADHDFPHTPGEPAATCRPTHQPMQLDPGTLDVVAIGSSTGAPAILTQLITHLPADVPLPILVAQHMPPMFTAALAKRLGEDSPLAVYHAEQDMPLLPGTVYIAPGRQHMRVRRRFGRCMLDISDQPEHLVYKPSVDELFGSLADVYPGRALGIVLSGMGRDGLVGAARMHQTGSKLITQTEKTCAVYGMPKAVDDANLSSAQLNPEQIRLSLLSLCPLHR